MLPEEEHNRRLSQSWLDSAACNNSGLHVQIAVSYYCAVATVMLLLSLSVYIQLLFHIL